MFFGNDFGYDEQVALQGVIWHYSDDTPFLDSAQEANEAFEPGRASRVADRMAEMVDYVDAHFEDLDYNQVLVNFYACEDQSIQNLLSIETVEGVRYSASSGLKITKSVESANEDAEEPFTFTVKLTNPDSSPYLAYVQAASEGETLHAIGPNANGEITLTTTGAGEAMLENIPLGVTYEVTEAPVNGWNLKSSTGTSGEIVEDTSIAHFVNSDGTNQNNDTPENNTPPNNDTPKNDTPPANTTPPDAIPPANNDTPEDDDVPENTTPPTTAPNNDTPPAAVPDNDTPKNDDTTPGNTVENTQPATMANVTMPKTEDPIVTWPLALIASSSLAVMLVANRKRRAL